MKKKRQAQNIYSGVKVTDSISMTLPKRKSLPDFIPLIIIAFCGCAGVINAFVSMFQIDFSRSSLNFYTIFFFALFSIIFILPKKFIISLLPIFLIYEMLLYRNWESYVRGFMLIYNQTYRVIFPKRSDYFKLDVKEFNTESATAIFIGFTIFILIALICYITIVKPNFLLGFLFTFPFIEIGLYYGKSPSLLSSFMVLVYWTSLLSVYQSGYYKNLGRSKTGFIRSGNLFTAKPIIKFRTAGQSGIIMMAGSAAIILASFIIINISGYSRSDEINTVRENLKIAVSEFTFEDIGGSLERISSSFRIGNLKMYDHRLGNQSSVSYNGSTDLTITTDDNIIPYNNIYLKGYIGSIYDGKSWSELDKNIYSQNNNMLELLKNTYKSPQDMLYNNYGRFMSLISSDAAFSDIRMTIEASFLNSKYNYTPYNSTVIGDFKYINDTIIELDNKKQYSFDVSPHQDYNYILDEQARYNIDYSQEYHDFVYENYLNVPNNKDTEMLYDMFIDENMESDTYSQLMKIKSILEDNAEYTLEPGKTPISRDFVNYFLTENHKGYCVHFATSGIVLARMSGIPARYAEGYVLLSEDFNEECMTDDGYKIEIKDNRAHAWAEIYLDGYGWIPFEFTPSSASTFSNIETTEITKVTTEDRSSQKVTNSSKTNSDSKTTSSTESSTIIKKTDSPDKIVKNGVNTKKSFLPKLSPEAKLTISTIVVIILIIAVISAIHYFVGRKRHNSFNTHSNSQNALNAYKYLIQLLEFINIKNNNMQHLEFAEYAEQNTKHLFKTDELINITQIALQAKLSEHEISTKQSHAVIKLARKTALRVFKQQNIFGRMYMKFIRNLC